jgi:dihydrofolate reductase
VRIFYVVAYDRNRVMGRDGTMPWHLPADLAHFKAVTMGKPVVMGRNTFASIGRALPGRRNIVVTHARDFTADGVEIAHGTDDVLRMTAECAEVAVIGGAQIFSAFDPYVSVIYATELDAHVAGNVFFLPPARPATRTVLGEHPADERNAYAMTFVRYDFATG